MIRIHVDVEARSIADLASVGSYRYVEDPSTVPLCVGWHVDGDYHLWWAGYPIPELWRRKDVVFVCHNAQFDRVFFNRHILKTEIAQWDDTMVRCRYHGLPGSLDAVSKLLFGLKKDPRGDILTGATDGRGVCRPQQKKLGRGRLSDSYWNNDSADLTALGGYCLQDVRLLVKLDETVGPLHPSEFEAWQMYERMNDNGIPIDAKFAAGAVRVIADEQRFAEETLTRLTGGEITSSSQIMRIPAWCKKNGVPLKNCQEKVIAEFLSKPDLPKNVREVLMVRELGKSAAVEKYKKALERVCLDGRIHGEMVYYGAHTGRASSRGVQIQNPKRGKEKHYIGYREAVKCYL